MTATAQQRQGGVDVRKRLIQVIAIAALALGLVLGSGVVSQAASPDSFVIPCAMDGGGSGT
jgi:hypothetical protein